MNHQRELRHAAAQAFIESLNQWQETLCPRSDTPTPDPEAPDCPIDLEQAVADIEQFMQESGCELPPRLVND